VTADLPAAFDAVLSASQELAAYEAGAHAYVDGFVFPVAGPVEFIDSWGYPRMMGSPSAHWHQGTDIFATAGTPLVASENGVLERVGNASLGGIKLWVVGESGNEYYYAHLSAFAEGVVEGKRVRAGEVIGYVGDTGNARGTSPHLHFEIHPDGLGPANPYPLLKAAYGARPMARAIAPTTTVAPPVGPPAPGG
jgi:murein DD-endopeptidase MepM/ murein hydrolase activator NlpD